MDGYSVNEAAEVLGIPQARVWELIARGVLAGASEGATDMRVFLRPPAAPVEPAARDPAGHANGERTRTNGESHAEASPFRELLTEFRSLTERYGQALLALGEARGEVAALRSRVELLEARMDMRLPLRAASTVAWELPDRPPSQPARADARPEPSQPEPAEGEAAESEPAAYAEAEAAAPEPGPAEPTPAEPVPAEPTPPLDGDESGETARHETAKRRATGGRAALAGLAEALARAEDPTLAELPGAREAAEALAALQREVETISAVPPESAIVGPPTTEVGAAPQSMNLPSADGSLPASEQVSAVEPVPEVASLLEEPAAFAMPIDVAEPEAPTYEAAMEPEAPAVEAAGAEPGFASDQAEAEPAGDVAREPPMTDSSIYTTEVVEPDWFADGDFAWLQPPEPEPEIEPGGGAGAALPEDGAPESRTVEDHLAGQGELAGAEAIQDAFEPPAAETELEMEPMPEPQMEPVPEPEMESMPEPEPEAELSDSVPAAAAPADDHQGEEERETPAEPVRDAVADAELTHLTAEDELPAAEAIQEAFTEPHEEREPEFGPPGSGEPPESRAAPQAETGEDRAPAEYGEPAEETPPAASWPAVDSPPPTPQAMVGFGLYRGQPEADASHARPIPASPPPVQAPSSAADEEALMWWGGELEAAELEVAAPGWHAGARPAEPAAAEHPLTLSDAEIDRLANDEGWDSTEVEAIRDFLGRPATATPDGAPDEVPPRPESASVEVPTDVSAEEPSETDAPVEPAPGPEPRAAEEKGRHAISIEDLRAMALSPEARGGMQAADPEWLRGRRGPAATAYRRLRRLFQG